MAFWVFQLFWCWIVSMPVTILNSPAVVGSNDVVAFGTASDVVGIIMWGIGFLLEVVADQQKYNYKSARPARGSIMNTGVWVRSGSSRVLFHLSKTDSFPLND